MFDSKPIRGPGFERMVERQMRNWELARAQRIKAPEQPVAEVADFITISRQVGAGGTGVAEQVAQRLGWAHFDRELLRHMAGDDDVQKRLYESLDERDTNWIGNAFALLLDHRRDEDDYFHRLMRTVLSLARKGSAVYLGRGVDHMLPRGLGLRVRLVAPQKWRINAYAQRNNVSPDQAASEVKRTDKLRAEFVKRHFNADIDDPLAYDLALSVDRFSQAHVVEMIVTAHQAISPVAT